MKREIKFRAWLIDENRMVYGREATSNGYFTQNFMYRKSEIELMEFTGKQDDDNKDIYEGDIVRVYGGEYYEGTYEFNKKCIVKWQGNGFDLFSKDGYGNGWGFNDCAEEIKVIGNIYENKKLLEEN